MSIFSKTRTPVASATDTATFRLPISDIADLRRRSASSVPLDDEALLQDCSGDVDLLLLLLEEFQTNGPHRIEQIALRVAAGNPKFIAVAARNLKTSADALSAKTLRDLAGALEQSTGLVSRGCQERLVARLRKEMNRCLDHIPIVVAAARAASWSR